MQSFVFLGLLVFELEPMYATSDRRKDRRTTDADDRLMPPPPLRGRGHNNTVPLYVQMKLPYSLAAVTWSQFRVYGLRHVAWRVNVDLRGADRLTLDNRLVEWTRRQPTNQKIVVSSANSMSLRPQQHSLHVGANRLNVNDLRILPSPSERQSVGRLCLLPC